MRLFERGGNPRRASSFPPFKTPSGVFFVGRLSSHEFSLSDYCFTLRGRLFHFAIAKFSFTLLRATSAFRSLRSLQPTQNPTRRSRHLNQEPF